MNDLKNYVVSIVIPVYNGSDFVCEAVESALNQTYSDVEVVVVNDGSNDDGRTRDCLKPYLDRIVYIEKENGGVASALNEGISRMSGDFFTWLSHDDLFDNNKVKRQIEEVIKSGNDMTISAMNYTFFDDVSKDEVESNFHKYYSKECLSASAFLLFWGELHFSSLLFSRKHFERVGLFNENLLTAQDNDFIFRLLKGQRISFVEDVGSYVRIHKASGTATHKDVVDGENSKLFMRINDELSEKEKEEISGSVKHTEDKLKAISVSMGPALEKLPIERTTKDSNIVLVGAGVYGRRLNYELIANGIKPKMFLDNNPQKDGNIIDGTVCRKLDLSNIKKEDKLVVTNRIYSSIVKQLNDMGIKEYYLKSQIDRMILDGTVYDLL